MNSRSRAYRLRAPLIIGAVLLSITFGNKISALTVTSDGDALTYLLRNTQRMLYVSDNATGPQIGGYTRTPFDGMGRAQFERACASALGKYDAVVVEGSSNCLERHRTEATSFIQDDHLVLGTEGFTAWIASKKSGGPDQP